MRFVLLLFTVAVVVFGQAGIFGPVSARLKAGDFAPEIVFSKIWNAAGAGPQTPLSLSSQLTVLTFYPDTSHNLNSVSRWNALVAEFAGKPVQFVWITQERESTLATWLAKHPLQGLVALDPDGATGRSYGIELPAAAIVGPDRRIVGFDPSMLPTADTLNAALENRITTTPVKKADWKAFLESRRVLLKAEPPRMPGPDDHKPNYPPSYTLRVSPSQSEGGGNFGGMDYWSLEGFDLKGILSEIYNLNPIRIHLPSGLDDGKRYDFSLVLPEPESKDQIYERFRQGVQDYFHVSATRETVALDVYIVKASNGRPPAVKRRAEHISLGLSSVEFQVSRVAGEGDAFTDPPKAVAIDAIRGISVEGTMDDFCRRLEAKLDRPLIDETNLQGEFRFHVKASDAEKNDFLDRLRDQLGLVITPVQRNVEILALRPN